jgi:dTDP-4-amino-4,6-dideoxygalactose transaminase
MRLYVRHHIDIGWTDLAFALRALLASPASGRPPEAVAAAWPAQLHATPCLSVRTAFDALLSVLRLPAGSEIVMSAVTIAGMQQIARHHGLVVRAADVEPGTLAPSPAQLAACVSGRTRLVLIAHLFGSRVDLAPFAPLRAKGVLLVEDCAQSWSPEFRGSPEADVSLFSFGPIKTQTALGGAVAAFRDGELAGRFAAQVAAYPGLGRWWYAKRIAKYAALKLASGPLTYGFICRALQVFGGDADLAIAGLTRGFGPSPPVERFRRRPPQAMLALLARRLSGPSETLRRQRAARALLGETPAEQSPGSLSQGCTYWVAPVLVDDPDAVRLGLLAHGFDATRATTSMRVIGDDPDGTPRARAMMERILYLPSPAHLPDDRLRELRELIALSRPRAPRDIRPPSAPAGTAASS